MIPFTDAHTHRDPPVPGILALRNPASPEEIPAQSGGMLFSAGIHPRDIGKISFESLEACLAAHRCAAVGECGLDRTAETDFATQEVCFLRHAELADARSLPLVLTVSRNFSKKSEKYRSTTLKVNTGASRYNRQTSIL